MDYKVLIVEDEEKLRDVLCDYFISRQDVPVGAQDGVQALELIEEQDFDAVLLDIMMPGLDGFGVCRAVRRKSDVPIVFLTALSDEDDKLKGYELGADDYITKPFTMSVLYAKVSALIKRSRGSMMTGDRLEAGEVSLQISTRRVWAGGREITLTPKEYALLECLMKNRGIV
ncbi:MAG: response regulator transcription factor, partial [Firmicutes bacterium]|nr:response regulator transcription factor [Bacillota bacterium]